MTGIFTYPPQRCKKELVFMLTTLCQARSFSADLSRESHFSASYIHYAFWISDRAGNYLFELNSPKDRLTQQYRAALKFDPKKWLEIIWPADLPKVRATLADPFARQQSTIRYRLSTSNRGMRHVEHRFAPIHNARGRLTYYSHLVREIRGAEVS